MQYKSMGLKFVMVLLAGIVFCFIATGIEAFTTLTTREEAMRTFVRLAVKDAIVGIQTTEEFGYDITDAGKTIGYSSDDERNDYTHYLNTLAAHFAASASGNEANIELIKKFLVANNSEEGDALFRPVEFGMTYVSPRLFEAAFKRALQDLIKANYASNDAGELGISQNDAIYINWDALIDDYIDVQVDGPKAAPIPADGTSSVLFKSIYGTDKASDMFAKLPDNLGFQSASIDFYVYYDIKVTVNWKSTMSNPLLRIGWLADYGIVDNHSGEMFDPNGFLRIAGPQIVYSYRYVLTN